MRSVQRTTGRAGLVVIASLVLGLGSGSMAEPWATSPAATAAGRTVSGRLSFEANRGQVDAEVRFVARGTT